MLISVGHGSLDKAALQKLLRDADVEALVDIRRYPGSRRNPDVSRDAIATWTADFGLAYRWDERLGGRRRLPPDQEPEDSWWRVQQFAAYAAYTRTPQFGEALTDLLDQAHRQRTAMMCSEAVWWRCHRRIVADVAMVKHDVEVCHLMHDGRLRPHPVSESARLRDDGHVVWQE